MAMSSAISVGAPPSGRGSFYGSLALGAIVGGLRGFSRRGRRSYREMPCFVWEPRPRGDCWWSAGLFATGASLLRGHCPALCGSPALGAILGGLRGFSQRGRRSYREMPCFLWEPRPRGDSWWSARIFATGASLLQGHCLAFCGNPASVPSNPKDNRPIVHRLNCQNEHPSRRPCPH